MQKSEGGVGVRAAERTVSDTKLDMLGTNGLQEVVNAEQKALNDRSAIVQRHEFQKSTVAYKLPHGESMRMGGGDTSNWSCEVKEHPGGDRETGPGRACCRGDQA